MPGFAPIDCPTCGATLRAEDMNAHAMAATCHACHAFVDLRALAAASGDAPGDARTPLPVPMPSGVRVERRGSDLAIVRRWISWRFVFLLFFCVVWNGFLVFWYGMAFAMNAPLVFKVFPLLHVAVGVFLVYTTIAGFLNRTVIRIERDHLTVRHGPLPWRGNRDVSALDLEQLFCTQKLTRNKNGTTVRYGVEASLKDGRHLGLASGLEVREQALFIEQAIEQHLGIQDRRVRSEIAR